MADDAPGKLREENEIPMDVRSITYGSGRKLTPEERKERRRKRREEKIARGESVGDSDDSDDDDDDEGEPEEIQDGMTEIKVPKLNLDQQVMETDIDAVEELICPRKVRFDQMGPQQSHPQGGSVLSTPRSVTTDELEARLEDLRRQTDRILYVLDCMDSRLGGPGLVRGLDAPKLPPGAAILHGPGGEGPGMQGPISPGSSFRSQAQDSIGPEIAAHDHSYGGHKIPGSAFSLPNSSSNGHKYGSYGPGQSNYSPNAPTSYPSGAYTRPIGFVGVSGHGSRWGPQGKGSGLGVLADCTAASPKLSEVQYIEQQTQCLLRDLEALQSIVIPPPAGTHAYYSDPRGPTLPDTRSSLRRTQSLRASKPRSARSYGYSMDPGPVNNSLQYLTSLIQIRRSVVGVTDRLRPMDYLIARGRR